jgi:hypothetical protein
MVVVSVTEKGLRQMMLGERKDKILVVVYPLVDKNKEDFVVEMNLAASDSMTN